MLKYKSYFLTHGIKRRTEMEKFKKFIASLLAVITFVGVVSEVNLASAADTAVKTGNYILVNAGTNKCLTLKSNSDKDNADFNLKSRTDGEVSQVIKIKKDGGYLLQPAESTTRFLTIPETLKPGDEAYLYSENGSPEQEWTFAVTIFGEFVIKSAANSSLVLAATDDGDVAVEKYSEGDKNQRWKLVPFVLEKSGDKNGVYEYGIDVSTHNGDINWLAVKEYGVKFAILRLGYGQDYKDQDDAKFKANADACQQLGIPFGVYLYSYATTVKQAQSEARHCLRLVSGYNLSLPIYYDLEDPKTTASCSNSQILKISKAFAEVITDAGYEVGFYSNTNWWTNRLTDSFYNGYSRWVAQYYTQCTYKGTKDIWQYSSKGKVAGIKGNTDMNVTYFPLTKYTYTGAPITPSFPVTGPSGEKLVLGRDYTVKYFNNINAGTAHAQVTGLGEYDGFSYQWKYVINPRPISGAVFSEVKEKSYTGKAIEPYFSVTYGGRKLVSGKDFTVKFSNNKKIGTATITVTGKGNFTGTRTIKFVIKKLHVKKAVISGLVNKPYNGKHRGNIKLSTTAGVKLEKDKDYTVEYKNNREIGKATVTIKGIGKYCAGTYKTSFNIIPNTPKDLKKTKTTLKTVSLKWGTSDKGTYYQLYRSKDPNGKYELIYSGKNTSFKDTKLKSGTFYFYKVRAVKKVDGKKYYGEFGDILKVNTKLKNTDFAFKRNYDKKTTRVKIEAISGVTGYMVYQYKGSKKTFVKVYQGVKPEYVIRNCKKGTTYRVKIRTYKDTKYGRIYGTVSEVRSVKFKH